MFLKQVHPIWRDGPASNPDVNGTVNIITNIVVVFCLRIMVTWSPEDVDIGVQSLFIQIYPMLVSTLASVNREQMTYFDTYNVLLLSSSPLTAYVVFASVADLFGVRTGLYKRINCHRRIARALGAMILPLWIGLSLTYYLSDTAFGYGVDGCGGFTFVNWLLHLARLIYFTFFPGVFPLLPFISTTLLILYVLFKNRVELIKRARSYWDGASNPWARFLVPWKLAKYTWHVIDHGYKWFVYILFAYLDASWASAPIITAITRPDKYVMSYGQVSALLVTVPTILSTAYFIYSCRQDILHFIQRLPGLCWANARNLFTRGGPDPPDQESHLSFDSTSYPESSILGKPGDQIITSVRSAYQPPLRKGTMLCTSCATPTIPICDKV